MRRYWRFLGIDKTVSSILIGRLWSLISGPFNIFLLATCLSPEEQGYYYAFLGVAGISVFFELGLGVVLTQFFSHEYARLEWNDAGQLEGEPEAKRRIASILRTAIVVYALISLVSLPVILGSGVLFFGRIEAHENLNWFVPWILLTILVGVAGVATPITTFISGCGRLGELAKIQAIATIVASIGFWIALYTGMGLYAICISLVISSIILWWWCIAQSFNAVIDLMKMDNSHVPFSWSTEVWPMQWRIAVSWLAGYFAFQAIPPIIFQTHGAIEAGKVGMTIGISYTIGSIGSSWINANVPKFGELASARKLTELNSLFKSSLTHSIFFIAFAGFVLVFTLFVAGQFKAPFLEKMLPPGPFALVIASALAATVMYAESCYLRSFKEEPLMPVNMICSICTILTIAMTPPKDYWFFGMGMLAANVVIGLGFGTFVFLRSCNRLAKSSCTACSIDV